MCTTRVTKRAVMSCAPQLSHRSPPAPNHTHTHSTSSYNNQSSPDHSTNNHHNQPPPPHIHNAGHRSPAALPRPAADQASAPGPKELNPARLSYSQLLRLSCALRSPSRIIGFSSQTSHHYIMATVNHPLFRLSSFRELGPSVSAAVTSGVALQSTPQSPPFRPQPATSATSSRAASSSSCGAPSWRHPTSRRAVILTPEAWKCSLAAAPPTFQR